MLARTGMKPGNHYISRRAVRCLVVMFVWSANITLERYIHMICVCQNGGFLVESCLIATATSCYDDLSLSDEGKLPLTHIAKSL